MSNAIVDNAARLASGGGVSGDAGERLQFVLPSFPPSVNQLYTVDHNRRLVRLSDNALLWKTRTIPFVKPCRWSTEWLLKLTLDYHSDSWYCKNGKLRRFDVQNLEKLVIDTLFAKWGWDDSRIVEKVSRKRWGKGNFISVLLEKANQEGVKSSSPDPEVPMV